MKIFRKAVLIIHGFAGGTYDEEILNHELELKWNYDVFTFTLPGHEGMTTRNIKYTDWIEKAEYEINYLIDNGYKNIYLVGHSMGGVIAGYLASKYKQVKKLVLVAPAFRHYGYEDVLLGKTLHQHHVPILHIDNPLGMCTFETNAAFVAKTEEGLRTLYTFRNELRGFSRLLTFVSGIHLAIVRNLIRLWHQVFKKAERRNLCGSRPSLWVFKLYRLGYYLSLQ